MGKLLLITVLLFRFHSAVVFNFQASEGSCLFSGLSQLLLIQRNILQNFQTLEMRKKKGVNYWDTVFEETQF